MPSSDNTSPITPARVSREALLATFWTCVTVSFCFLCFRIYVRTRVVRKLYVDDAFIVFAWICSLGGAIVWQVVQKQFYMNVALAAGETITLPTNFLEQLEQGNRGLYSAYVLSYTGLWCVKLGLLFFFRSLNHNIQRQRILWWVVFVFILACYPVSIGTLDHRCLLNSAYYVIANCRSPHTVSFEFMTLRLMTSLDILTDAAIVLLSTNILWRVRIDLKKKLMLFGIFSLTLLVVVITIVRIVVATTGGSLDLTWLVLWAGVENAVAIIVACLASFRVLYTHSTQSSNKKAPYRYVSDDHQTDELPLQKREYTTQAVSRGAARSWDDVPSPTVSDEEVAQPGIAYVKKDRV